MYFENRTSALISLLMAFGVGSTFADTDVPKLGSRFDWPADQASGVLIARLAGEDSSVAYASLSRSGKAAFLDAFWKSRNPLVHKYYYGLHLGRRRFNVSDYFFERMSAVPELFKRHIDRPNPEVVDQAENLIHIQSEQLPKDPFVLCALGYILLEGGKFNEADGAFSMRSRSIGNLWKPGTGVVWRNSPWENGLQGRWKNSGTPRCSTVNMQPRNTTSG